MSNSIDDLLPAVQIKARLFLDKLTALKIPHVVTSTRRSVAVQVAYYAQGRAHLQRVNDLRKDACLPPILQADNLYTVTNCDGVTKVSRHQAGRALDIVPAGLGGQPVWPAATDSRWQQIGEVGESCGFEWGGRWEKFPDMPHYEIA